MSKYRMPENFRVKLQCRECDYSIDMDGHNSMECIDASLSGHIGAHDHTEYELQIYNIDTVSLKQRKDLINMFDGVDDALPLTDMIHALEECEHDDPGKIIKDAIENGILYIDEIEDENLIYIALTNVGEEMWEAYHEDESNNE